MHIARQPFVPAFLTLFALGILVLCFGPDARPADALAPTPDAGLAVGLPDRLLAEFQSRAPGWARLLALFVLFATGITAGRISARSNLYGVNTCLAIPLCGLLLVLLNLGTLPLPMLLASLLFALSLKRFGEALCDGYSFDALFRGSLQLGLLVLVAPAALPLLLLLPFGVLLFHRTHRESVVALAGLLLGPALLGYVNWSLGGTFAAPFAAIGHRFADGALIACFRNGFAGWMALAATIVLLDLGSIASILTNIYSVSARARCLLLFHMGALALAAVVLAGPGASPADCALLAVPSAMLLPFLFVRIHASLASLLYLLLLAAAVVQIFSPIR